MAKVGDACRNQRVLRFAYYSGAEAPIPRLVETLTLVWRAGRWYLFCWCRLRSAYRLFRVDAMDDVTPTSERFRRRPGTYAGTVKLAEAEATRVKVRVTVRFSAAKAALAPADVEGSPTDDDQGRRTVRLDLALGDVHAFCGSWGADLEILGPTDLRDEFAARAAALFSLYHSNNP